MTAFRSLRKTLVSCMSPTSRKFGRAATVHSSGNSDTDPGLFNYTSGRWIYNENLRLKERVLHFNVAELKKAAAAAVGRDVAQVQNFRKLAEGGFNRAFELTVDGIQVIAKVPYPLTFPKHLSIASEVATIDLVRSYGVPAPKVLDYSATSENAVGVEYVIMEKVNGRDLSDIWYELTEKERIKVTVEIAKVEGLLFSIPLPACGSVYYRHDLGSGCKSVDVKRGEFADQIETADYGELCIGPDVSKTWWYDTRDLLSIPRGPFLQAVQSFTARAWKELEWLKTFARPRLPAIRLHGDLNDFQEISPSDHIASVEKYLQIAPHLVPDQDFLLEPTLKHSDLQPHNILIADDFSIAGVIDWQHCTARPLILQAGVPEHFQNFDDEESHRLRMPQLPEALNEMSEEDRLKALEQYRRRHLHFYYFVATYEHNKTHFDALNFDATMSIQRLEQAASAPWEGDNTTLKADLVRATQIWPLLTARKDGSFPECPIHFSDEEIEQCLNVQAERNKIDEHMARGCKRLGVAIDGWTAHERYEDALEENQHIKNELLAGQDEETKKALLTNWPWDDHEETG